MKRATPIVAARPAVSLAVEPDEKLTTDWLKRLVAAARAWAAKQKEAA